MSTPIEPTNAELAVVLEHVRKHIEPRPHRRVLSPVVRESLPPERTPQQWQAAHDLFYGTGAGS